MHKHSILEPPLAKEIAIALAVKAAVLCAIWYAFFNQPILPSMINGMDPGEVGAAVVHRHAAESR